jgi:hypothetical protein
MPTAPALSHMTNVLQDASAQPRSVNSPLEEHLRAALGGGRHVSFDRQVRADCFLFGALCAKAGVQLPLWMVDAVLWAHEAALRGYSAFWRQRTTALRNVGSEHLDS